LRSVLAIIPSYSGLISCVKYTLYPATLTTKSRYGSDSFRTFRSVSVLIKWKSGTFLGLEVHSLTFQDPINSWLGKSRSRNLDLHDFDFAVRFSANLVWI
jgi:hypothetical protein